VQVEPGFLGQGPAISWGPATVDMTSFDFVFGVVIAENDAHVSQCISGQEKRVVEIGVTEDRSAGVESQCYGQGKRLLARKVEGLLSAGEDGGDVGI